MSTDIDADRLRTLVAELDRLLAAPGQQAAVNPDGSPGNVAAGELIESAWGNAVANTINTFRGVAVGTTSQSIPGFGQPQISFVDELYDTDNYHAASDNKIVIPANRAGTYGLAVTVTASTAPTGPADVTIDKTNAPTGLWIGYIPTGKTLITVAGTARLAVGDVLQVRVFNNNAAAVVYQVAFNALRLGP